jgi:hypothetical protein
MTLSELANLQVKLTYGGPQLKRTQSVVIVAEGASANVTSFTPYRRSGFSYQNDDQALVVLYAPTSELDALIDQVATLPLLTAGGVDPQAVLSFSLLNVVGGVTKCYEAEFSEANGRELLTRMRLALSGETLARLSAFACGLGMVGTSAPTDVTSSVVLHFSGARRDVSTREDVGTVTVKNVSGSPLLAPISVVLRPKISTVALANRSGRTCLLNPPRDYINLPVAGSLAPGATVEVQVRFYNPGKEAIDLYWTRLTPAPPTQIGPRVFAGAGER